MPQRTHVFKQVPWVGGINTSVDSGVLNAQELTIADNVIFSATGARIKREAYEYLDAAVPAPDFRSSSGTTRTLKWTTSSLVNISSLNERLVNGERIKVTGLTNYDVTTTAITSRNEIVQVSSVICVADVAGSLAGKYFTFSAGDQGAGYYAWFKVSGTGTDPAVVNRTGIEVDISTGATASAVATALSSAINSIAVLDVSSAVDGGNPAKVLITNLKGGLTTDGSAGTSGFTFAVTTKGGHSITYEASSSLSESLTAASGITVTRTAAVISYTDYWRFNSGTGANEQYGVYVTESFQLFRLDESNRRVQIHGQEQVTQVICAAASTLTTGDHFLINGPNNVDNYYVWYNVDSGGGDPAPSSRTGIEVIVASGNTATQVATATKNAINVNGFFSTTSSTTTLTITAPTAGITADAVDTNTGFVITTTFAGATFIEVTLTTAHALVYNNRLEIALSGLGNKPIYFEPGESLKYQLLPNAPDMSVIWEFQGRMWGNSKLDPDFINYSPPFDDSTWGGIGDSGGFFVGSGDGDPVGITNGYKYKDLLIVSKSARRYRVIGDAPENYFVEPISEGLGNEGALAIPVDESDVVFLSHRGIHSQAATDQYGDTASTYLSAKIKPTFNTWEPSQLKHAQGAWIPEINSFAISIPEQGHGTPNAVWLYNVEVQVPGDGSKGAWYRWPDVSCTALSKRYVDSRNKLIFGTADGRIIQAQKENSYTDFDTDGIGYKVKTGTIYVDNDSQTLKAYKKITLLYRPRGNFSFNVSVKIDNFTAQAFSFNQISGLDLLGETFILGSSLLGSSATLAPFTFSMEGVGRGLTMEITQPSREEQIEVWGYMIEWEPAGTAQEVV